MKKGKLDKVKFKPQLGLTIAPVNKVAFKWFVEMKPGRVQHKNAIENVANQLKRHLRHAGLGLPIQANPSSTGSDCCSAIKTDQ